MGKFIFGAIVGILALFICGYFYFSLGLAPVATSAAPMPFEKKFANMALHARVKSEAPKQAPFSADEPNLTAGAKVYVQDCAFCHGLPGRGQRHVPAASSALRQRRHGDRRSGWHNLLESGQRNSSDRHARVQ